MRILGAAVALALVAGSSAPMRASSILYFVDKNFGTDQMDAALATLPAGDTVTVATSPLDFATKIAGGTYDLGIFSQQYYADFANPYTNSNDFSTALTALETFVAGGGKAIVDTWSPGSSTYVSAFGADYTGNINGPAVNMSGFNSGVSNPVTVSNPPGYATFSTGMSLDATNGISIAGTFLDPGNASGTDGEAAVIIGDGGRSIVNGFLNDTAGAPGEQIYINEIDSLLAPACPPGPNGCAPTPEPSYWVLLAAAMFGMIAYRRLRVRTFRRQG